MAVARIKKKEKRNNKNNSTSTGTIYILVNFCRVIISFCTIILLCLLVFLFPVVNVVVVVPFLSHYYYDL